MEASNWRTLALKQGEIWLMFRRGRIIMKYISMVVMKANDGKSNPGDGVIKLECFKSWSYEVDWIKTWNSVTNFTDCKQ